MGPLRLSNPLQAFSAALRKWMPTGQASRPKVFCIGLPKTGTTTFGVCMQTLRYKHHSYDMDLATAYVCQGDADKVIERAMGFDSFDDWPWFLAYRDLDKAFPGSKFVVTRRRDTETYVNSHRRHRERHGQLNPTITPEPDWWQTLSPEPYGSFDAAFHARNYEEHYTRIDGYFAGRDSDVLRVCWETGDGWEELCAFLNRPVPNIPFPHANRGAANKKRLSA